MTASRQRMAAGAAASLTQGAGLLSLCPTREPTSTRPAPPTRQVPPKWEKSSARSHLRTSKREEVAHGISDCRQLASSISTSSTAPSNLGQTPECSFPPYLFHFLKSESGEAVPGKRDRGVCTRKSPGTPQKSPPALGGYPGDFLLPFGVSQFSSSAKAANYYSFLS